MSKYRYTLTVRKRTLEKIVFDYGTTKWIMLSQSADPGGFREGVLHNLPRPVRRKALICGQTNRAGVAQIGLFVVSG